MSPEPNGNHLDTNHSDDAPAFDEADALFGRREQVGVKDAAELMDVHPNTIRNLQRKGQLAGIKVAGVWTFDRADVEALAEERAAAERDRTAARAAGDRGPTGPGPQTMALMVLRQWEQMQQRMAELQREAAEARADVRVTEHQLMQSRTEVGQMRDRVAALERELREARAGAPQDEEPVLRVLRRRWMGRRHT